MAAENSIEPASLDRSLVAPLWHTIVFLIVVLGTGLLQGYQQPKLAAIQLRSRLPLYASMIVFELILLAYVWLLGLRPAGKRLRDLIGGKWSSLRDVLSDISAAIVFWVLVAGVLIALQKVLGGSTAEMKAVKVLLPQTFPEMAAWIILASTAGFCEEVVFRGYLQRQFFAMTGSLNLAVVLQAIVFGSAHLYQGTKSALTITIYGAMFGILAAVRKSLRPGMIQHAGQDIFSGIAGSLLARRHYF
ncbi:MAG TPA: type II CAAX endopeptidase family protein [Candidatus Acidoferrales bacterium]|nr:type II CAAX endopeptidase family protein [Candidatus Acidoferrales bacterium]